MTVLDASNTQWKIRLMGIDAPEKRMPFGQRSKQNLSDLVFNKQVAVEYSKQDRYGRSAFKYRRCIIPASGFYEWKTELGKRNAWFITLKSGEPMAMAGLWETWQPEGGDAVQTCCIITTGANELMLPIHDRMPVILDREQWGLWLSHHETKSDRLLPSDAGVEQVFR